MTVKKGNFPYEIIEKILEELSVGLTLVDNKGKVIYFNNLAGQLLNWKTNEPDNILKCHSEEHEKRVMEKLNKNNGSKEWHRIIKIKNKFIENTYSPIKIPEVFTGVMIITKDVTKREKMYRDTKKEAITDGLTGLFNRNYLNKIMGEIVRKEKPFGALMIDINGLKFINDNYGHAVGDRILKETVKVITENVRVSDYVFRYGGDEFLVLLNTNDNKIIEDISRRIKAKNSDFTNEKFPVLNFSIGYSSSKEVPHESVISLADKRMYEDKQLFIKSKASF